MIKERLTSEQLKGVTTALVTPFDRTKVDLDRLGELIDKAGNANISGVVPLGTTGESPSLTADERHAVIQMAVDRAKEGLAVIVGAGTNNTKTTIENIRQAADLGADGVLIVAPYYNKPTPAGLKKHFNAIADAAPIPIVLYHIPGRCGVGIPFDLVLELAKHENIIGIKEAGGDVWRSGEIARRTSEEDFAVLSGDDSLTTPLLSVGAVGVISVISNLTPRLFKKMVDFALAGDLKNAMAMHHRLSPLLEALSLETNPAPIKEAMVQAGVDAGQVRLPLAPVKAATRKVIAAALEETGGLE